MANDQNFLRAPVWYPVLAAHTFLTSFVKLRSDAQSLLASGDEMDSGERKRISKDVIEDLRQPMSVIPGNCFSFTDLFAPTDTERFEAKRGAVFSPESAWKFLCQSKKIQEAAKRGEVEYICLRPFRRMNRTREFRLFIRNGELNAMSQYYLIRHFRRLEGIKDHYWQRASEFVKHIAWQLPLDELVMDIYFTSSDKILILDLNPWGEPTDPLLLRKWERDWSEPAGIVLMAPPTRICGDVNVSF